MKKKLGVYAGSFNPFHVGHADIVRQAKMVFDKVIVAIGVNTEKANDPKAPFPTNHPVLKGVYVTHYNGLLSDYLNQLDTEGDGDNDLFLIRGLRNGADLSYEQNQYQFLKEMYPGLREVFFICDKKFEHISSSALRALKKVSEREYLKYVFLPVPDKEPAKFGWEGSDL